MIIYDKNEIRDILTEEQIFELLEEFGGQPEHNSNNYIISDTICHNPPGEGSHKLYYYFNSKLFRCYTGGCEEPVFDIFQLIIKVMKIQNHTDFDLNDSIRWIANKFHINGRVENGEEDNQLEDWKYLANYDRIQDLEININNIVLKEYDNSILNNFNYDVKIQPWIDEGIHQEILDRSLIGFYPGGDQITIPHFDKDGRFVGLRGRTLSYEDADLYGKYRPLKINKVLYTHPLGMNLYNLNNSKKAIKALEKAIVFEGEKSSLKYASYFGIENDISVACCGSNLSAYQIQLLIENGAKEIIIAFDRQFQEVGDQEFKLLKRNLVRLYNKYHNDVNISFIFDKNKITEYKASPIDEEPDKFLQLFKERIVL